MPHKITARNWLTQNNYSDVTSLIDDVMGLWVQKGTKTRRSWWDVLSGDKNGNPRVIEGIAFPVLRAAQIRMGLPVSSNAICRNEKENPPPKLVSNRWAGKTTREDDAKESLD